MRIDRAAVWAYAQVVWRAIAAAVNVALVVTALSPEEQGFYYVFFSLIAAQQLFEAGQSFSLLRNLSGAKLELGQNLPEAHQALLTPYCLWYGGIGLGTLLLIGPAGALYLSGSGAKSAAVMWHTPWLALTVVTAANAFVQFLPLITEASGKRDVAYRSRFISSVSGGVCGWAALILGAGLFAPAMAGAGGLLCTCAIYWRTAWRVLPRVAVLSSRSWKSLRSLARENWRINLTWTTGYFYWNVTPLLVFQHLGPEMAGRYGLASGLLSTASQFSSANVSARTSLYARLISERGAVASAEAFRRDVVIALATFAALGVVGVVMLAYMPERYSARMPSLIDTVAIAAITLANLILSTTAVYSRLRRDEPFLRLSLVANLGFPILLSLFAVSIRHLTLTELLMVSMAIHWMLVCWCISLASSDHR